MWFVETGKRATSSARPKYSGCQESGKFITKIRKYSFHTDLRRGVRIARNINWANGPIGPWKMRNQLLTFSHRCRHRTDQHRSPRVPLSVENAIACSVWNWFFDANDPSAQCTVVDAVDIPALYVFSVQIPWVQQSPVIKIDYKNEYYGTARTKKPNTYELVSTTQAHTVLPFAYTPPHITTRISNRFR